MGAKSRIIFYQDQRPRTEKVYRTLAGGGLLRRLRHELVNRSLTYCRVESARVRASLGVINIEPTNRCNHKCQFCLTGLGRNNRPKGNLTLATFKKAIENLFPGVSIIFAGFGEPFLNEDLELFLEHARTRGLARHIQILSNFGAISEQRIRSLLDHPFHKLIISLDAMSRQTFLEHRGCDDFERVFTNIRILAEDVKKRKPVPQEVAVQMVVTRKNLHEKNLFIRTINGLGLNPIIKTLNTHNSFADERKIDEYEVKELSRYTHSCYRYTCEWVWGGMMIFWNGDVTICCQDADGREVYGNVNQQNTIELLNTAHGRCGFRRRYFDDPAQISICRRCDDA